MRLVNAPALRLFLNRWLWLVPHLLGWSALILAPIVLAPVLPNIVHPYRPKIWTVFPINLVLMGAFYFNGLVLVPRVLYRRGTAAYGLVAVAALIIGGWLISTMAGWTQPLNRLPPFVQFPLTTFPLLFVGALSLAWYLVRDQRQSEERRRLRETENLRNELAFLRSQISPHFLFNVLNSTVALARKRSDRLEAALLRLSSLLRYMLYESDDDRVGLDREVEYLRAYIDLQLLRFGDGVTVSLDVPTNEQLAAHAIAPMLLIPFLENAFKHGVGLVPDPVIEVSLRLAPPHLHFQVRNRFVRTSALNDAESLEKDSGIGLANVTRRLELLYQNTHTLSAQPTKDGSNGEWFEVRLRLPLAETGRAEGAFDSESILKK